MHTYYVRALFNTLYIPLSVLPVVEISPAPVTKNETKTLNKRCSA